MNKQKGWPSCVKCDQWEAIAGKCTAINEEGLAPCQTMSRRLFIYLLKEDER